MVITFYRGAELATKPQRGFCAFVANSPSPSHSCYSSKPMSKDPREQSDETADRSFADILKEFESTSRAAAKDKEKGKPRGRGRGRPAGPSGPRGTVVSISSDFVLVDYGGKSEGIIPASDLKDPEGNLTVKQGDTFNVAITGFNSDGMAKLSRIAGPRPKDWDGLQRAFENKEVVAGRVTGQVKGGFTVDLGTRAFMPASRSGVRDAADMEKLVGQEVRCRIIKLDVDNEDLVVDRRSVMEEEANQMRQNALESLQEGATVRGTVRSLENYGAFIDIGGVDGLLHVGDISWARVTDPSTELAVGDALDLKVLRLDKQNGKISLGLKQMSPDPWEVAAAKLNPSDRVTGEVTRLADFGGFVEVLPGVEGVVLKIEPAARRRSLGLKQVVGNQWDAIKERYPNGKIIEGKVTRLAK